MNNESIKVNLYIFEFNGKRLVHVSVTQVKRQTESHQLTTGVHNVELVLVVDYAIYRRNNGDMYRILKRVFDIVNVIKQVSLSVPTLFHLVVTIGIDWHGRSTRLCKSRSFWWASSCGRQVTRFTSTKMQATPCPSLKSTATWKSKGTTVPI